MLSDINREGVRKRRAVGAVKRYWGDAQKLECVQLYLALGNLALTAATLKIPEITVRKWKATEWWKNLEQDLKLQDQIQVSNRLKSVIDKSLVGLEDRLDKGDFFYNPKTGEILRKPMGAKDLTQVANLMLQRKQFLEGRTVSEVATETIQNKLDTLKKAFEEIASKKEIIVVDGPLVKEINAVHD